MSLTCLLTIWILTRRFSAGQDEGGGEKLLTLTPLLMETLGDADLDCDMFSSVGKEGIVKLRIVKLKKYLSHKESRWEEFVYLNELGKIDT